MLTVHGSTEVWIFAVSMIFSNMEEILYGITRPLLANQVLELGVGDAERIISRERMDQ